MKTTVKDNLRIDYTKYQADELAGTISDALFFPLYVGEIVVKNLLIFLVAIGICTYFGTYHWSTAILFFILSLVVTIPSIIIFSAIRLLTTIKEDLTKVYTITIDTAKHVYADSNRLVAQRKNDVSLVVSSSDVFKGVAIYAIQPIVKRVLAKRIKFFAPPFIWIVNLLFKAIFLRKPPEFIVEKEIENQNPSDNNNLENKITSLGSKTVDGVFMAFKFPFRFVLIIYGIVNALLILLFISIL
ncbi:hypothetical protein [Tenacibaculum ovolyticum]|uniref:hypothetical protein n=1 Tax=Tenacibaculum ovolyticum TaxID=104270 RepID=UPI001F373937|nr:hypothetical protein [Tenacibaculum ovolyticum]